MRAAGFILICFFLLQSCKCPATCDDCEGGDNLPEPTSTEISQPDSEKDLSGNPIRECSHFIELDGEPFCCDEAFTIVEMTHCSKTVIDSLTVQLDSVYNALIQQQESDQGEYYTDRKTELENSQKTFLKNLKAERKFIQTFHQGRESIIHQNTNEIALLEHRIELLKAMTFY